MIFGGFCWLRRLDLQNATRRPLRTGLIRSDARLTTVWLLVHRGLPGLDLQNATRTRIRTGLTLFLNSFCLWATYPALRAARLCRCPSLLFEEPSRRAVLRRRAIRRAGSQPGARGTRVGSPPCQL